MSPVLRAAVFSANSFIAAMVAMFIAFRIGLDRPLWAVSTVYIVSQPLSGAIRSKALFRMIGTVVGAAVPVVLVPMFITMPLGLSLALSLWVAVCLFVAMLDRTPRSYMFMLSGYTAAIVGFSACLQPEAVFDIAVLRSQEIGLGVACATVAHMVSFPQSVTAILATRIRAILAAARQWIGDTLSHAGPLQNHHASRRLALDIGELHVLATHVPFDTATARPTRAAISMLQYRMVVLLPLVAAVEDRAATMVAIGHTPDDVMRLFADVREWIARPDPRSAEELAARCQALLSVAAGTRGGTRWGDLLALNLLARLHELILAWRDIHRLADHLAAPTHRPDPAVAALLAERAARPLHLDYRLALRSSLAALIAVFGCCVFWIVTGWPDGASAPTNAAIMCCFFAASDDPAPAQRGFLVWTAASMPLTALYLFAILPQVHDFEMLMLSFAPLLLPLGMLCAIPRWQSRVMPMMMALAGGLSLSSRFSADPAAFLNITIAQLAGALPAIAITRLFRSMGAAEAIRRIRQAGWHDLAQLAERPDARRFTGWSSRMLDRAGLIAARVGDVDDAERDQALAVLRELRVGRNLVRLAEAEAGGAVDEARLREAIARHYRRAYDGSTLQPEPVLLDSIDTALTEAAALPADAARARLLVALTGLRRELFPTSPGWAGVGAAA